MEITIDYKPANEVAMEEEELFIGLACDSCAMYLEKQIFSGENALEEAQEFAASLITLEGAQSLVCADCDPFNTI